MGDTKTRGRGRRPIWQNREMSEKHPFSVVLEEDRLRVSAVAWILSLVNTRKEKNVGQKKPNNNDSKKQQVSIPLGQEHTRTDIQTEGIQGESD